MKESNFLKVDNSSLKSQIFNLEKKNQETLNKIQLQASDFEFRRAEYERWKHAIEAEHQSKLEIQRMEIINEYNVLLRNRGVRLEHDSKGVLTLQAGIHRSPSERHVPSQGKRDGDRFEY